MRSYYNTKIRISPTHYTLYYGYLTKINPNLKSFPFQDFCQFITFAPEKEPAPHALRAPENRAKWQENRAAV